jgi:leucyl aminopeptidase
MTITTNNAKKDSILLTLTPGKETRFVEVKGGLELRLGKGTDAALTRRKFILLARKAVICAKQNKFKSVHTDWKEWRAAVDKELSDMEVGEHLATAFLMANLEFTTYKTKPKDGFPGVDTVAVENASQDAKKGVARGTLIGQSVNACRELSNTPGGDMTPALLAAAAKDAIKGTKATLKVLDVKEMEALKMGAVLGVGKGSTEKPKFIILEYWGEGKSAKTTPVVLVGKGVTFDSGGLNIKTGDHMYEMHMDMSGGAAVIHAVALAAKLGVKRNIIGLVPAVENMLGHNAFRPGDILRSMSGKTIEIINTDAEGRVILADALTYAKRYNPEVVVEASTLTGAALVALGLHATALMTTDSSIEQKLRDLGERSGDYVWPLPLWDEYDYMVESNFGDIPNIPVNGNSRYAGSIGGGKFLQQFANGYKFAHLDIAPRMTAAPGDHLAKGAAGTPVRLFLQIAENF